MLDKEFIKQIDLPGLSVDDIEVVLTENEDWSGEQIDQFLHSAIDLSEIESKLFSMANYESDSGYSAYDVSPIARSAPANICFSGTQIVGAGDLGPPRHPSPSQGLFDHHNSSPLFGNPTFMSLPLLSPHSVSSTSPSTSSLLHEPLMSPCPSDGGFFSPHSSFSSLTGTPNHDSFFPSHSPVSLYSPSLPMSHDFNMLGGQNNSNIFSMNSSCFPEINSDLHNISLPVPGMFLHDLPSHLPCSVVSSGSDDASPSTAATPFLNCSQEDPVFREDVCVKIESLGDMMGDAPEGTHDIMSVVKEESLSGEDNGPSSMEAIASPNLNAVSPDSTMCDAVVKIEPGTDFSVISQPSVSSSESRKEDPSPEQDMCKSPTVLIANTTSKSDSENITHAKKTKSANSKARGKDVSMKGKKKKSQWPRSMNRANLLAFRQRILNKLKKGQEIATDASPQAVPVSIITTENPSSSDNLKPSSSSPNPTLVKYEASSPKSEFEVQVMYEKNNITARRCHSEPANLQSFPLNLSLQNSHSEEHLNSINTSNKLATPSCFLNDEEFLNIGSVDTDNLLSTSNFNPDVLLSSNLVEMMLDGLGFDLDVTEGDKGKNNSSPIIADADIAKLISGTEDGCFSSTSPLSQGNGPTDMSIDCIHDLLTLSKDCASTSPLCSSPCLGSPDLTPAPLRNQLDFGECCITRSTSLDSSQSRAVPQGQSKEIHKLQCSSCNSGATNEDININAFHFPEILSVEGSMVLDGVNVISEGAEFTHNSNLHMRDAFLQSTHDPLLASERHSMALFDTM